MTWGGQRQAHDLHTDRLMNTLTKDIRIELTPLASSLKRAKRIILGVDVHAERQVVVRQIDAAAPQPPQCFSSERFLQFVRAQQRLAEEVYTCYEAGPFGYVLHRQLAAMGVRNLVVRPRDWDTYGHGVKTDQRDAAALCSCLDRYLAGNRGALAPVRVPTVAEEQARALGRQRQSLQQLRVRLLVQGKSAALLHGVKLPNCWVHPAGLAKLAATLPPALVGQLRRWQPVLRGAQKELDALTRQLEENQSGPRPVGLGALTLELISGEVCDWQRFRNRRQVGSYTGLCPSEHSSGSRQRQGHITRHGNPRLRHQLIEAAWRLMRWQPAYQPVAAWQPQLADPRLSTSRRKKIAVAIARRLAVDLWRLATGRTTAAALGLRLDH
jgi:transposase